MDTTKLRYALGRLRGMLRPPITVRPAPAAEIVFEHDVAVTMRDGTVLRVNVFRPRGSGAHPAILCAHPYGKDNLPTPKRGGGFKVSVQYRLLRMPEPISFSAWTTWEGPDPAHWVPRGYAVVNCDLRGCGSSDGVGDLMSPAEHEDYHDLIEWATAQPWCSGKVGLNGVSYLALSQYGAAATRPPSLAAICPWEGFTDPYRDLLFPGGVREDGFVKTWAKGLKSDRLTYDLRAEQLKRPLRDAVWATRAPELAKVEVPMLVCGSFSDTAGWLKLSHRGLDPDLSRPFAPVHRDDVARRLEPGEVAEVELALGPSATFFRAGEEVRLVLSGRWPNSRNLFTDQFLAAYEPSPDRVVRIHCGGAAAARLLVPAIAPG